MDGIPVICKQLMLNAYIESFKLSCKINAMNMVPSALSNRNVMLSCGSLQKILDGIDVDSATLQILGYKRVPGEGIERFRLLVNDGILLFSFAVLATHLNSLIKDRKLEKFSVFKLNKYACNDVQPNKKIILCLDITPLIPGCQINSQIEYNKDKNAEVFNNNIESSHLAPINHSSKSIVETSNTSTSVTTKALMNPTSYNNSNDNTHPVTKKNITSAPTLLTSAASKTLVAPSSSIFSSSTNNSNQFVLETSNTTSSSSVLTQAPVIPSTSRFSNSISNNLASNSNWDKTEVSASRNVQPKPVVPIFSLTPYQNKWTIRACVIYKTPVSCYSKDKKSGKLFSFFLLDDSGEIKATAFDRQAEELYQFLQINKLYYISGANVRLSRTDSSIHDFELTISDYTKIELVSDDNLEIPELIFNFIDINQIVEAKKSFVDVIGICVAIEKRTIVAKATNKEIQKLDVHLMSMDQSKIIVTVWGNEAENYQLDDYPVIAFKRAKVTEFNGCSLNMGPSSMMFVNPNLRQAHALKSWFNEHRSSLQLDILERNQIWKTVADINELDVSNLNVTDYSTVKATIVMVQKDNAMYQACPLTDCFKKVSQTVNGQYHCNKCNKDYDTYSWTLLLKINIADFSSGIWAVAFRETAEFLLNLKSTDLSALKEQSEDKYQDILSSLHFKSFIFKLRSRVEVFNDTNQLKISILDSKPINTLSYTKKLLLDINRLEKILSTNK
ncbi:replication protein A 70 kDa DNA-binding subunit-like [Parasteatoda tepidariorum]|uniref:replication protein A 70 kDa DNA-binding subunit-like n=1 Tax=Parasteatoda tepidariorum TaxID=114398 RepID=UPI001C72592A|nr:replication protein A 70 kDa DNA-binding subunit-like [Parasteatoda tepidariorum]